ncbi:MAG: hypothetical protein LBT74_11035 [Acidobacteriota bacterium]|jgi:hypothetical protein|nr:hypothetical protein [Acidobacteriota bacterium]
MKHLVQVLLCVAMLSVAVPLTASEVVIYGGTQKPGDLSLGNFAPTTAIGDVAADFGGTFGARFSAGRVVGFEQNISISPKFAQPGVKAFQTDSNLLVQAPGKIVPYGTVGIGVLRTWGGSGVGSLETAVTNPTPGTVADAVSYLVGNMGSKFTINYGGGLKVRRLWGPIGINVDVRGYTIPSVKLDYQNANIADDSWSFIQTTAGLVITW